MGTDYYYYCCANGISKKEKWIWFDPFCELLLNSCAHSFRYCLCHVSDVGVSDTQFHNSFIGWHFSPFWSKQSKAKEEYSLNQELCTTFKWKPAKNELVHIFSIKFCFIPTLHSLSQFRVLWKTNTYTVGNKNAIDFDLDFEKKGFHRPKTKYCVMTVN